MYRPKRFKVSGRENHIPVCVSFKDLKKAIAYAKAIADSEIYDTETSEVVFRKV